MLPMMATGSTCLFHLENSTDTNVYHSGVSLYSALIAGGIQNAKTFILCRYTIVMHFIFFQVAACRLHVAIQGDNTYVEVEAGSGGVAMKVSIKYWKTFSNLVQE